MYDVLFLLLVVIFFVACQSYVLACDKL